MKIIQFAYCNEFKCMAEQCPETCCQQWNILFSQSDYLKIKNAECSEKLKNTVDGSFVKVNGGDAQNYGIIRLNDEERCPLLDKEGLCMLWAELGGECLGYACRTFPRLRTKIGEDFIYALDISCPKAAELLIKHTEGLNIIQRPYNGEDGDLNGGIFSAPAVSECWEGFPYYWAIKNTQIKILQNRSFTVPERMLILGYFSHKANQYINHKAGANIISLAAALMDKEMCGSIAHSLKAEQTEEGSAVRSVSIFAKMYLSAQSKCKKHIKEMYGLAADSIGLNFKETGSEKEKTVTAAFDPEKYRKNKTVYTRLEGERPHIIENILVNLTFTQPLSGGVWKNYFILAVFYNVLKTCLPAFLGEDCTDGELAAAISKTAKMTVNNDAIKKDVLLDFVDNRAFTLAHGVFLI